jgi:hypothetical protein
VIEGRLSENESGTGEWGWLRWWKGTEKRGGGEGKMVESWKEERTREDRVKKAT